MTQQRLSPAVAAMAPELTAWRRRFHAHPELSYREQRTGEFIAETLSSWGIPVTRPADSAVVGLIEGGRPGPTVALRADMDALSVQEENEVPYASTVPGVMHACGHDGHMAVLLGVARVLWETRGDLAGRIKLIFQPAEEQPPGGALALIEAGVLEGVSSIVGLHLWADLPVGSAAVMSGPVMASADEFSIEVTGRGGHGAQPHRTVDALVVASQIVLNLQTIVSRKVDPQEPAVITIGTFNAGHAFNVIAPSAGLTGTSRSLTSQTRDRLRGEIERVVEHTCAMAGSQGVFRLHGSYPALVNDPVQTAQVTAAATEVLGSGALIDLDPVMSGEDFSYYAERLPACYFFLGVRNEEKGIVHSHHHPRFDMDEAALPLGVEILVRAARRLTGT